MDRTVSENPAAATTTASSTVKFVIGLFAALCAVFLPKIIVYLEHESGDTLRVLSVEYIVAGVAFSLLVGGVVLILKWKSPDTPGNIFMTALGVLALLSGTLGAVGTAENLNLEAEQRQQVFLSAMQLANVPVLKAPITLPEKQSFLFDVVAPAVAADAVIVAQPQAKYGVQVIPRQYVVVIAQLPNRADARARALRSQFPNASVLPAGDSFYVTTSVRALSEVEALAEVARVRQNGLQATLVPVQN